MALRNTLSKKSASSLVTFDSGPSKTHQYYCLVRRNRSKFLKEVLPSEECIDQREPPVCDFKFRDLVPSFAHNSKI